MACCGRTVAASRGGRTAGVDASACRRAARRAPGRWRRSSGDAARRSAADGAASVGGGSARSCPDGGAGRCSRRMREVRRGALQRRWRRAVLERSSRCVSRALHGRWRGGPTVSPRVAVPSVVAGVGVALVLVGSAAAPGPSGRPAARWCAPGRSGRSRWRCRRGPGARRQPGRCLMRWWRRHRVSRLRAGGGAGRPGPHVVEVAEPGGDRAAGEAAAAVAGADQRRELRAGSVGVGRQVVAGVEAGPGERVARHERRPASLARRGGTGRGSSGRWSRSQPRRTSSGSDGRAPCTSTRSSS